MENLFYEKLKRFYSQVYWWKEKASPKERAWYNGYFEAVSNILQLFRQIRKETKQWKTGY